MASSPDQQLILPLDASGCDRTRAALLGSITRKENEMDPLLGDRENLLRIQSEFKEITDRVNALKSHIEEELCRPDLNREDKIRISDWYEEKSRAFQKFIRTASDWMDRINDGNLKPIDSASVPSRQSGSMTRSKTSSKNKTSVSRERGQIESANGNG